MPTRTGQYNEIAEKNMQQKTLINVRSTAAAQSSTANGIFTQLAQRKQHLYLTKANTWFGFIN